MTRILIVDDCEIIHDAMRSLLSVHGYETLHAHLGKEALEIASKECPDLLLVDLVLPDMSGADVTRFLRMDARFAHTPMIVVSAKKEIESKLLAFSAGADDYLVKPMRNEELTARISGLLARRRSVVDTDNDSANARLICVHGLRGGAGCSSLAVNLAVTLKTFWNKPVLVLDAVPLAGQVEVLLNGSSGYTWEELSHFDGGPPEEQMVDLLVNQHRSGLHYIAAPRAATVGIRQHLSTLADVARMASSKYEYIVVDLPHDLEPTTMNLLKQADRILFVLAPDFASVLSTTTALKVYEEQGIAPENVSLVRNCNVGQCKLSESVIGSAIKRPVDFSVPFSPTDFSVGINSGEPLVSTKPKSIVARALEDIAFDVSKPAHINIPPPVPTKAWHQRRKRLRGADMKTKSTQSRLGRAGGFLRTLSDVFSWGKKAGRSGEWGEWVLSQDRIPEA